MQGGHGAIASPAPRMLLAEIHCVGLPAPQICVRGSCQIDGSFFGPGAAFSKPIPKRPLLLTILRRRNRDWEACWGM